MDPLWDDPPIASWERSDLSRSADGEKTLTYLARRPGPTGMKGEATEFRRVDGLG